MIWVCIWSKLNYSVTIKRIKWKKWWYKNKYLFANKQQDDETDLQYFEKRYYDNRIWRFTTEDPVFWEVSRTKRVNQYFTDPQQWNSYSYVRNNPINYTDPTGEAAETVIDVGLTSIDWYRTGYHSIMAIYYQTKANNEADPDKKQQYQTRANEYEQKANDAVGDYGADAIWLAIPGVSSLATRGTKMAIQWALNFADVAKKIWNWHAFSKHIGEFKDLWIKTKDQLVKLTEGIMKKVNGTNNMKNLENGRKAYWDDSTKTVVIHDPNGSDAWTVFHPSDGKTYFSNLK